MKRVLVILHIWYKDQIDYFISKLQNISGCEWDLWVTMGSEDDAVADKLKAFKGDTKIIVVPNVGYDIGPYIRAIKGGDISDYDYIMKLHTKGSMPKNDRINGVKLGGWRWRDHLVNSLLGTKKRFQNALAKLENEQVGMVCCYELYKRLRSYLPEDSYMLEAEAARIGCRVNVRKFCAGSMFIVRTAALKKIIDAEIDFDLWDKTSKSHSTGSLAHVYERLLCLVVADAGYKIACSRSTLPTASQAALYNLKSMLKTGKRDR